MVAACTNPAALGGGSGELHAYMDSTGRTIMSNTPAKWLTPEQPITTPFVSVPGLLTAECASNENATGFLKVTVHGDPTDLPGRWQVRQQLAAPLDGIEDGQLLVPGLPRRIEIATHRVA